MLDAGEPALGALPRGVWAVKTGWHRTDGRCRLEECPLCRLGCEPGFGGEGVAAVVAVWNEAVGGVAAAGELFGEGAVGVGSAEVLLDGSVAACACAPDNREPGSGWLSEEVDGAADRVGAVKR